MDGLRCQLANLRDALLDEIEALAQVAREEFTLALAHFHQLSQGLSQCLLHTRPDGLGIDLRFGEGQHAGSAQQGIQGQGSVEFCLLLQLADGAKISLGQTFIEGNMLPGL